MKNSVENVQKRQKLILEHLAKNLELSVESLAQLCNSSSATIRRDLTQLEDMGVLKRTHGGARIIEDSLLTSDTPELTRIRHALAKAACSYIKDNDILFFNSSKTALFVLHYLERLKVTIITNNVKAIYLKPADNASLILTGGEIRFQKEAMVGDIAINTISNVTGSICIMGCNGFHPIHGVTTESLHEAKVNNLFFENTVGTKIVIADYRKIGNRSPFKSVETQKVDILITDIYAPIEVLRELEKQGVKVVQIDPLAHD